MIKWNKEVYQFTAGVILLLVIFMVMSQQAMAYSNSSVQGEVYIIDRIEASIVSLEKADGTMITEKLTKLPKKSKEGDVLKIKRGRYYKDAKATRQRTKEMKKIAESFWK